MEDLTKEEIEKIKIKKQHIKDEINGICDLLFDHNYCYCDFDFPYTEHKNLDGRKKKIYDIEIKAIKKL